MWPGLVFELFSQHKLKITGSWKLRLVMWYFIAHGQYKKDCYNIKLPGQYKV